MSALPDLTCRMCGAPADKYVWCRPCIKKSARGAAAHFLEGKRVQMSWDDPYARHDYLKRETNRWEKRFKRRLRRR